MPAIKQPLRYLALGDSYTIGEGVGATERFPHLAVLRLQLVGIPCEEPVYIATTGWTTTDLIKALDSQSELGIYDVVTLLIGVNDQYQKKDTGGYCARFTTLLDKAIVMAGNQSNHVFVLSIPDYSATPFVAPDAKKQVHSEINSFNNINKTITQQKGAYYIDITPLTREAATDPTLLTIDGLHYLGKEHQLWADLLASAIQKVVVRNGQTF